MIKTKFSAQVNLGFGDSEQSTGKRLSSFKNTKLQIISRKIQVFILFRLKHVSKPNNLGVLNLMI